MVRTQTTDVPTEDTGLTNNGEPIVRIEGNSFGAPNQLDRFTREQIVQALRVHALLLHMPADDPAAPDTDKVTTEIRELLKILSAQTSGPRFDE